MCPRPPRLPCVAALAALGAVALLPACSSPSASARIFDVQSADVPRGDIESDNTGEQQGSFDGAMFLVITFTDPQPCLTLAVTICDNAIGTSTIMGEGFDCDTAASNSHGSISAWPTCDSHAIGISGWGTTSGTLTTTRDGDNIEIQAEARLFGEGVFSIELAATFDRGHAPTIDGDDSFPQAP